MTESTSEIEERRIVLTENAARQIAVLRVQENAVDGVEVVVDDVSLGLLNGAEVDFVEDLMGASFQIKNPNAASSCGCGNSFSIG
jgi:Fe-S cluster assembly iron-binding protein IscA